MRAYHLPQGENRDFQIRIYWFFGLIAAALLILLLRAWYLQVLQGKYYLELSENNRLRIIGTPSPRGRIYDRHGSVLVNNPPSFNLYVVLGDMPEQEQTLNRLADLIEMDSEEIRRRLTKKDRDLYLPIKIKEDLTMKEVAQIEGHRLELPGVKIESEFKRNTVYGTIAAHLIGYVGEITQEQLTSGRYAHVKGGSIIGKYGVEQAYDSILRGMPGWKRIEVDALGHERRVVKVTPPLQGDDIFLTLDLDLQRAAEEVLSDRPGAIVAMDPRNGEILAMVSHPAFNPNILSKGISPKAWEDLLQDDRRPLTNRVIHGQYPPGSIYKIILGAAVLETKTASPTDEVTCKGFVRLGGRNFRDWKRGGHGQVNLHRSLVESCDVYYYEMGRELGVDTIAKYAALFGLGKPTGIGLASEKGGLIPTTDWKKRVYKERWFPGETLSVSIGQGFVLTTPLQLAAMINTVAADGIWRPPQLLKKIGNRKTGIVEEVSPSEERRLPISAETFRMIRDALAGVVSDSHGTAAASSSEVVSIGGKTGTAQVVARREDEEELPEHLNDHAWFVAYAPVENPEIAVVVLVENGGHGGATAAPLARDVIEAYLGRPTPPLTAARGDLDPAQKKRLRETVNEQLVDGVLATEELNHDRS